MSEKIKKLHKRKTEINKAFVQGAAEISPTQWRLHQAYVLPLRGHFSGRHTRDLVVPRSV